MKEKESQGPAKRAKIGECVDLVEHDELRKQAEHLKKVEMENKELREAVEDLKGYGKAMEELKGMVECPVCQNVPRHGGPVPVCLATFCVFLAGIESDKRQGWCHPSVPPAWLTLATAPPCLPPGSWRR